MTTRRLLLAAAPASLAAPNIASAQTRRWRMVTSWPKNLIGPGTSADRIARTITRYSGGRLEVQVFAANEIVPAFGVLDAVGNGTVEMGHSASLYWQGKEPGAAFFTSVPFGLTPPEHMAWIAHGGGQEEWDALYAPFGVKPFMGGNTGYSMGGWFKNELKSTADIKGLKIRMAGIGAELYSRLGATPIALPSGDTYAAFERGAIDAVEFTSPASDYPLGLYKITPLYYVPGFTKPNGSSEVLINLKAHSELDGELKALVSEVCASEAAQAVAEMDVLNRTALGRMVGEHGVRLKSLPADFVASARKESSALLSDLGTRSTGAGKVLSAYRAFAEKMQPWTRISALSYLSAREG